MISRRDLLTSAALAAAAPWRRAGAAAGWQAGVASADITPAPGIWMAGFAARREAAQGTALPLHARVLALSAGEERLVVVALDLLGTTAAMRSRIAAAVARAHQLPDDRLLVASSHTHSGPVVDDQLAVAYDLDEPARARIASYTTELEATVVRLVGRALADLSSATVAWSEGAAHFGANRRTGFLPPGPTDPSVPVLRVTAGGRLKAVVFGYACHNTTLQASMVRFHGDYAGVAAREIEARHPGLTALFLAGCGADVNPAPRGTVELVEQHGRALADAVSEGLDRARPVGARLSAAFEWVDLPFALAPGPDTWRERLQSDDVYVRRHARLMLDRIAREGRLEAAHAQPVQAVRLGDVTLVALGGEVVTDYALRLKREHASSPLWVAAYCNDVSCYVPSFRVLHEGGYEGGGAMIYYGRPGPFDATVEQRLVSSASRLIGRLGAA